MSVNLQMSVCQHVEQKLVLAIPYPSRYIQSKNGVLTAEEMAPYLDPPFPRIFPEEPLWPKPFKNGPTSSLLTLFGVADSAAPSVKPWKPVRYPTGRGAVDWRLIGS